MKLLTIIILLIFSFSSMCNSQSYNPLGLGFNTLSSVRTLYYDSTSSILYAGGSFTSSGDGTSLLKIAKWDNIEWNQLGAGVIGGAIESIVKFNGAIYAAGSIDEFGGVSSLGVGKWNGNNWEAVHDFTINMQTTSVYGLNVCDGNLYVLGGFNFMDTIPAGGISRFDGISWYQYPQLDAAGYFVTAAIYNNELYVGGNFSGGLGKNDIVKFDGTNWVTVGGGLTGGFTWVNDLKIYQNKLYVAGHFQQANGDPGNGIMVWDGSVWSQAGSGCLPSNVFKMIEFQNELYVGGQINNAGGVLVNNIAKWNGVDWFSLGSNFDNSVQSFTIGNNNLYIGGSFITVNGDTMNKITMFNPNVGISELNVKSFINIYPNPSSEYFKIEFHENGDFTQVSIQLFDITGRVVLTKSIENNSNQTFLDVSSIFPGCYQIVFDAGNKGLFIKKLIIVR